VYVLIGSKSQSYLIFNPSKTLHSEISPTAHNGETLTLSNPIFCHPHTPQLLFILGGKEVGRLLVIILQF
jgi:hypothetical protein